jgi:hypothetical protein
LTDSSLVYYNMNSRNVIGFFPIVKRSPMLFVGLFSDTVGKGWTDFPEMWEPLQNFRREKCDVKKVQYKLLTYIRRHSKKLCCHGGLAPGICAPLLWSFLFGYSHIYYTCIHSSGLLTPYRSVLSSATFCVSFCCCCLVRVECLERASVLHYIFHSGTKHSEHNYQMIVDCVCEIAS